MDWITLALALGMFAGAALYASVGHAGASAYIALMALAGLPQPVMRPTALVLNIIVASLGATRFARAGLVDLRTLWPLLLGSIPMAILGGSLTLPGTYYKPVVGCILLVAALRLLWPGLQKPNGRTICPMPVSAGIASGAGIGLLSGLTGTGGGIFLSPLLLFFGWAAPRQASGIAVVFILCNSLAGLMGNIASVQSLPADLPWFAAAVLLGALAGTQMGIKNLPPDAILKALGIVLIIAGMKLLGAY